MGADQKLVGIEAVSGRFIPSAGTLRIEWEAKRVPAATAAGWLKLVAQAISGRPLAAPVVDQRVRQGIAFQRGTRVF